MRFQFAQDRIHAGTKGEDGLQLTALEHVNRRMPDQRIVCMFIIAVLPLANASVGQRSRKRVDPVSGIECRVIEDNIHGHSCLLLRCFIFIFNWIASITNLSANRVVDKKGAFSTFRNQVG